MLRTPILVLVTIALVCWRSASAAAEILRFETIEAARLVGGASPSQGRLEVRASGRWGTVCEIGVDDNVAALVCRAFGHPSTTAYATHHSIFGIGPNSMPVWISTARCTGTEASIGDCPTATITVSECSHRMDVGIVCQPKVQVDEVRLVGGNSSLEGRVEIRVLEQWGTVCDDVFDQRAAQAVCRQVTGQRTRTFPDADAIGSVVFGAGAISARIWLDDVRCGPNAIDLNACRHTRFAAHNCQHREDVGVSCAMPRPSIATLRPRVVRIGIDFPEHCQAQFPEYYAEGPRLRVEEIRLAGGINATAGRVEVRVRGQWGTVCRDHFRQQAAQVVCRQVTGHLTRTFPDASVVSSTVFGFGSGIIWLDDVKCDLNAANLNECTHKPFAVHNCAHDEDVGITCEGNSTFGKLEVQRSETWGTVCDDGFNYNAAKVFCQMLNQPYM